LISLAGVIVVLALLRVGYILYEFYLDTASIAPGTAIRPMGVTFELLIAAVVSILAGGLCSLIGLSLSEIRRRWWHPLVAVALTWIPLFLSNWGFHYIVTLRKLVLSD